MNRLHLAGIAVAVVTTLLITGLSVLRVYIKDKDQRAQRQQVDARTTRDKAEKIRLVAELDLRLNTILIDISQRYQGLEALKLARRKVEVVYYEWLNENSGLFYAGDEVVRISGVRNGFFNYELPSSLKQYRKVN